MIMPAALVFIDENPQEAQSEKAPWYDGRYETKQCLFPADRFHIKSKHSYFPRPQAQCLSAMRPEPGVKQEAD